MLVNFFSTVSLLFVLLGCSVKPLPLSQSKIHHLSNQLNHLAKEIPQRESRALAKEIYGATYLLTKQFKLTSPPRFHNVLVNVGLRQKGLCYDWSDALYVHLKKHSYPHFAFHLVVAHKGEYFFEHNALVVTATNLPLNIRESILLDAWRHSGDLYTVKVKDDSNYHWVHRVDRCLDE